MSETILAIETSSETCSVALLSDGQRYHKMNTTPRGHATHLLPMIGEILKQAEIDSHNLDAIAVTYGPGAFTSIRIGVAVCQGLACAADIPVISVSSLAVLAHGAMSIGTANQALVALDARMNEVYFGCYQKDGFGMPQALQADRVASPSDLSLKEHLSNLNYVASGIGWQTYAAEMAETLADISYQWVDLEFPRAEHLLEIALPRFRRGETHDVRQLQPIYLRDQVVHS